MSENQLQKIVEHNQFLYSLNTEEKTASIIGNKLAQGIFQDQFLMNQMNM